jgi:hypothetical protein
MGNVAGNDEDFTLTDDLFYSISFVAGRKRRAPWVM